jgi:acyl carrier protein
MKSNPMTDATRDRAPEILSAVFKAIDDTNELLGSENQLDKSREAALVGPDAVLDSMAFINLLAAVEERLEEALGTTICFADTDGGIDIQAFRTVGALADYISRTLVPVNQKSENRAS